MKENHSIDNPGPSSFSRRKFINITSAGLCGLMVKGHPAGPGALVGAGAGSNIQAAFGHDAFTHNDGDTTVIGAYGKWAAELLNRDLPPLS